MASEWRVEELAREADVSVDTIRFYQKRRLLPPPRREGRVGVYGPEHLERLARIRDLRRRGLTLALISRLVRGELDATDEPLAAAVLAAGAEDAEEFLSLEELARRAEIPLALLEAVANEGLLVPRDYEGEPRYTTGDVAVVAAGMRLVATGLPLDELLVLARAHHAATREIARQAVAMFDEHVRQPLRDADLADEEKARRLVDAFAVLLPSVTTVVAHHFRRVLLEVAQEHLEAVGHETEIAAASAAANLRLETNLEDVVARLKARAALPEPADKAAAVDAMFDTIAPRYDRLNRILTLGLDVAWRRKAVRALGLASGARVLDIACGTGDFCREIEQGGAIAIGLDRSAGMLAASHAAGTRSPLLRGDGLALPARDDAFDGVTCGFALRNVVALDPLFAECARVLRPGGRVALLEVAEPEHAIVRAGHSIYFRHVVPFVGGVLSDRAAYRYLPDSTAYLPPPAELTKLLASAGFRDVTRKLLGFGAAQLICGTAR